MDAAHTDPPDSFGRVLFEKLRRLGWHSDARGWEDLSEIESGAYEASADAVLDAYRSRISAMGGGWADVDVNDAMIASAFDAIRPGFVGSAYIITAADMTKAFRAMVAARGAATPTNPQSLMTPADET